MTASLVQTTQKLFLWSLALTSLILMSITWSPAQQPETRQPAANTERRALDALNANEQATAERVARADGRVRELVGETGVRVVSIIPVLIKSESPEKTNVIQRQVEVILFHPEREVGARVVINLQQNQVASVTKLASSQVMMTNDDLTDAWQLALHDPEVVRTLGPSAQSFHVGSQPSAAGAPQNVVEGLPVRSEEASDPCSKHRCLHLLFRRGNDYLIEPDVVVDLTGKHVMVEHRKPDGKADH